MKTLKQLIILLRTNSQWIDTCTLYICVPVKRVFFIDIFFNSFVFYLYEVSLEEFFWLLYWFLRVSDLLRMHKELSRSIFLLHQCWIQRQDTPLYVHFLSILAWQYRKIFVDLWPDQKTQKEACEINVHLEYWWVMGKLQMEFWG